MTELPWVSSIVPDERGGLEPPAGVAGKNAVAWTIKSQGFTLGQFKRHPRWGFSFISVDPFEGPASLRTNLGIVVTESLAGLS